MHNSFLKNKIVLITGGTGSIGSEILKRVLTLMCKEVRIFSRDEYKQHQLKFRYNDIINIKYVLGDVRDLESIITASRGVDIIFHAAALKHVPPSEEMPEEFIKTNISGSLNIKKAALLNDVGMVVSISSDKAVDPANVMGLTKAIQEKVFTSNFIHNNASPTKFTSVRFGNVNGTKGSLFPILYHQIKNQTPITITHPDMTRFFMSKDEAVDLIMWAAKNGNDGEIIIKKMKSAKIGYFIKRFIKQTGRKMKYPVKVVGVRVGEKMHESLMTEVELARLKEKDGYYVIMPYSASQMTKDVLIKTQFDLRKKMDVFWSNNAKNYLSDKEIDSYIKEYIQECDSNMQII